MHAPSWFQERDVLKQLKHRDHLKILIPFQWRFFCPPAGVLDSCAAASAAAAVVAAIVTSLLRKLLRCPWHRNYRTPVYVRGIPTAVEACVRSLPLSNQQVLACGGPAIVPSQPLQTSSISNTYTVYIRVCTKREHLAQLSSPGAIGGKKWMSWRCHSCDCATLQTYIP